jgi:hypothetical protein
MKEQRRDFLKITTVGATGLALSRVSPAYAAWPSSGTTDLNPDISNMRVVACVDTAMVKSVPTNMTFDTQNAAIDDARVQANMDAMAMTLTQKSTPEEAWQTIFRSGKDWASSVVAVKVNGGEAKNTAHLAVLQKLSNLFIGWGVKPQNFIVYDGHTVPGAPGIFTASFSTTDRSKVLGVVGGPSGSSSDLLGGWKDAKLVDGTTRRCAAKIADGTVDVLINIANNKGHIMFGKVTLCMKNHYGTWEPDATHTDLNNLIFKMNKSDPIIGGNPPRQQLCIVDSMFCNKVNITGTPELMPCYLVMGTFGPAVDYLTVKKIREEVSGLSHDNNTIDSYVTSFGYTTKDPQWIVVPPASATTDAGTSGAGGTGGPGGAGGRAAAGAGGDNGPADASVGGRRGAGGVGGAGEGGARSGGADGSGGAAGTGGNEGSGGTGGTSSGSANSGGASGSGGSGTGGAGLGGSTSSGGSGGRASSAASATGGSAALGGSSGPTASSARSGCRVGGPGGRTGGFDLLLTFGAIAATQLRRLFARRDTLAKATSAEAESSPSAEGPADPSDLP